MSEMVDRVAEALWQAESIRCMGKRRLISWQDVGDERQKWQMMARAAIGVMHEPTDVMLAPFRGSAPGMELVARGFWEAMAVAAFSSPAPTEEG